jgi:hypothetical protein
MGVDMTALALHAPPRGPARRAGRRGRRETAIKVVPKKISEQLLLKHVSKFKSINLYSSVMRSKIKIRTSSRHKAQLALRRDEVRILISDDLNYFFDKVMAPLTS